MPKKERRNYIYQEWPNDEWWNMLINKDAFLSTFDKKESVITYIIKRNSIYQEWLEDPAKG